MMLRGNNRGIGIRVRGRRGMNLIGEVCICAGLIRMRTLSYRHFVFAFPQMLGYFIYIFCPSFVCLIFILRSRLFTIYRN
jgi:hypothetical protein